MSFGDVKFYSSRAFFDDDEDDTEYDVPIVSADWTEQPPSSVQTLLVSFGDLANGYCRQEVLGASFTSLGAMKASYSGPAPSPVTLALCYARDSTVVALCPDTRDADVANDVALQLVSLLECSPSTTIVVITTEHISRLRAASQTYDDCSSFDAPVVVHSLASPAFNKEVSSSQTYEEVSSSQTYDDCSSFDAPVVVHSLASPAFNKESIVAKKGSPATIEQLTQPAMIYSVPAAVLTACTVKKLPCVVYVAYTETMSGGAVATVRTELSQVLARHPALQRLLEDGGAGTRRREQLYVPDNYS